MATRKRTGSRKTKPYLQWSKRQSWAVMVFFFVYFVFIALCVIWKPEAAEWLVRLACYVMGVMIASLGFYNGNSVLEKIKGNKLLGLTTDGIGKTRKQNDEEDNEENEEQDEEKDDEQDDEDGGGSGLSWG